MPVATRSARPSTDTLSQTTSSPTSHSAPTKTNASAAGSSAASNWTPTVSAPTSSATNTVSHSRERPSPSDKFGTLAWVIREAYRKTKFGSLCRVHIHADATAVTISGKVESHAEEFWASRLAEQYARGIPVVVQLQVDGKADGGGE